MSLEAKIEALTAAVIANTEALIAVAGRGAVKAQAPAATKPQAPAETAAAKPSPKTASEAAKADTPAITYDDIKVPFLALVKQDRAKALEVIGKPPFGLASLKEAKPEQYADLLAVLKKALA